MIAIRALFGMNFFEFSNIRRYKEEQLNKDFVSTIIDSDNFDYSLDNVTSLFSTVISNNFDQVIDVFVGDEVDYSIGENITVKGSYIEKNWLYNYHISRSRYLMYLEEKEDEFVIESFSDFQRYM